jgi:hypothetical protein
MHGTFINEICVNTELHSESFNTCMYTPVLGNVFLEMYLIYNFQQKARDADGTLKASYALTHKLSCEKHYNLAIKVCNVLNNNNKNYHKNII